jgi:hypothetical protein
VRGVFNLSSRPQKRDLLLAGSDGAEAHSRFLHSPVNRFCRLTDSVGITDLLRMTVLSG